MLSVENVSISFGGLKAITDLSFSIEKGEIFGLIGPNGAGKTTMFNIITANYIPSSGTVRLDDSKLTGLKPHKVVQEGIARTFQNIRLFSSMSVLENVLIGFHNQAKYTYFEAILRFGRFYGEERRIRQEAMRLLEYLGIQKYANVASNALSYGNQRKVEIARALATSPKLLLLDEPAAGMNPAETEGLAEILERIRNDFDLTILLIEHDMKFVNRLCDRVLVLDYGKKLFMGTPSEAINHKEVIAAYLGDVTYAES